MAKGCGGTMNMRGQGIFFFLGVALHSCSAAGSCDPDPCGGSLFPWNLVTEAHNLRSAEVRSNDQYYFLMSLSLIATSDPLCCFLSGVFLSGK